MLNTSPDRIGELKIAITENKNVYAKFQYLWDAVFSKIACNILQVKELSKTRDLLLPKLMNGKVQVGL